jgi:hypothetical protein
MMGVDRDSNRKCFMIRQQVDLATHGVPLGKEEFMDLMVEEFINFCRGNLTIDELLVRPRSALQFCDVVRQKNGWFDLPDDVILRAIVTRPMNPD